MWFVLIIGVLLIQPLAGQSQKAQINFNAIDMDSGDRVIYVYDALCGWCYGFSDVINKLHDNYHDQIDFEVISGGMMTGDRERPLSEMRDYILGAYPNVERATGVKFGDAYLKNILMSDTYISSSVKPAVAMVAFQQKFPEQAVAFAKAIQYALYHDGKSLNDDDTFVVLAQKFGYDENAFRQSLQNPANKKAAEAGFSLSRQLGVTGFPTLLLVRNGEGIVLARGYSDYSTVSKALERALAR